MNLENYSIDELINAIKLRQEERAKEGKPLIIMNGVKDGQEIKEEDCCIVASPSDLIFSMCMLLESVAQGADITMELVFLYLVEAYNRYAKGIEMEIKNVEETKENEK